MTVERYSAHTQTVSAGDGYTAQFVDAKTGAFPVAVALGNGAGAAGMYVAVGVILLIFGFIYWTTAGYMGAQLDDAIDSEIIGLSEQYRERDLEGLALSIRQRIARDPGGSEVYLLEIGRAHV